MFELTGGYDRPKLMKYGDLLRSFLEDQLAWLRDRSHPRKTTDQNGRDSLATAVAAKEDARQQMKEPVQSS